jgi:hypothetical protein
MKRIIPIFLLVIAISSSIITAGKVFAVDEVFYSNNNILFYNPEDRTCRSTEIATSANNTGNAYNFFVAQGYTAFQSAAVVGNLKQMSGVEPRALDQESSAYGIAQWADGRKATLLTKSFYRTGPLEPSRELQVQLEYLIEELNGSEKAADEALKSSTSTDVKELAIVFGEAFEKYSEGKEGKRAQFAEEIYKLYGPTESVSQENCAAGLGKFVVYSQKDPKWATHPYGTSTITRSGCGPSSMAMIVATFSDKSVTPVEVADLGVKNGSFIEGVGTAHGPLLKAATEKWGLAYSDITGSSFDAAIDVVKDGGLVYIAGKGPAPFTESGHVVVMRGITADGKIIIADPWRNGADVYDKNTVSSYRSYTYAITTE